MPWQVNSHPAVVCWVWWVNDVPLVPQAAILGLPTNQWVTKEALVQKCLEFADLEKKRLSIIKPLPKERCTPIVYAQQAADFVSFSFAMESMFYTQEWEAPTQSFGVFLADQLLPEPDHDARAMQAQTTVPCHARHVISPPNLIFLRCI